MRTPFSLIFLAGLCSAVDVYLSPAPPSVRSGSLSASEASATLSRHLRLEYFEPADANTVEKQEAFVGQGTGSGLLLTLSEEDAKDVLPSSLKRTYTLHPAPAESALTTLIPTYLTRAAHAYSHVHSRPSHAGIPRQLDIFSVPSTATGVFLTEAAALVDFLESSELASSTFAALPLTGLRALAAEHGETSEQYKLGAETLRAALEAALAKFQLHLAVVTVPSATLLKRQDGPESVQPPQSPLPVPSPGPAEPIAGVSTCFESADACANGTDVCSGHGQCSAATKAGRTCYVCACEKTEDEHGRTTTWAGEACERQDVSGPFMLVAGTVVTLVLTIGASIYLLSGVGSEELPSVLTGGVANTRKD